MKITKFAHACVLVEDNGKVVLIDPGSFAWDSGKLDLTGWPKVNEIVVTHEHGDHFDPDFARALLQTFPDAVWVTHEAVAAQLKNLGVSSVTTEATDSVQLQTAPHEKLPPGFGPTPPNVQADIFGKLSHPGDSFAVVASKEILAVPFISPWGSMTQAADMVVKLKPKKIMPIHDFLWKEDLRAYFYNMMKPGFADMGVEFIIPTEGEAFEV